MSSLKTLAAGAALAFAALASSGAHAQGIDQREANQQARIQQGVMRGQLTPREAARLEHRQRHIRHAEMHARADGVMTPRERARLQRMQMRASRDIYRQRHDGQGLRR